MNIEFASVSDRVGDARGGIGSVSEESESRSGSSSAEEESSSEEEEEESSSDDEELSPWLKKFAAAAKSLPRKGKSSGSEPRQIRDIDYKKQDLRRRAGHPDALWTSGAKMANAIVRSSMHKVGTKKYYFYSSALQPEGSPVQYHRLHERYLTKLHSHIENNPREKKELIRLLQTSYGQKDHNKKRSDLKRDDIPFADARYLLRIVQTANRRKTIKIAQQVEGETATIGGTDSYVLPSEGTCAWHGKNKIPCGIPTKYRPIRSYWVCDKHRCKGGKAGCYNKAQNAHRQCQRCMKRGNDGETRGLKRALESDGTATAPNKRPRTETTPDSTSEKDAD